MDQYILFDVGANRGDDSIQVTRDNPHYKTYAFEPTPELIGHLSHLTNQFASRYTIVPVAVCDYDGYAKFNVTAHADWGCSSLLTFNEGLDVTWPDRTDFFCERSIEVIVRRLDGWLKERPHIEKIDFFHCDTQGTDLAVLKGMGDYVHMIQDGVIEVPQSADVRLYIGQHTKEEAMDFLSDKGFAVYKTMCQQNEDNIYFRPIRK